MLLHKSDIQNKVTNNIKGTIARIGGTVNQLMSYDNCTVQDFNVLDGGYGDVRRWNSSKDVKQAFNTLKRQAWQELRHVLYGDKVPLDRATVIADAHFAYRLQRYKHTFDACISSNVIEHSYNPILLLLNFHFLTKKHGWQHHAIPHYKFTFDKYRKPTPVSDFINDFEKSINENDTTHTRDYVMSAIIKSGYKKEYHKIYPISYPFMHFHVFDEHNTRKLFEYVFTNVTVDVIRTQEFSDVVVIANNNLNPRFVAKHKKIIEKYSKNIM